MCPKPVRRQTVTHVSGKKWIPIAQLGPRENGAPGEIRTPDLLVRSQALYPTELRAQGARILPKTTGGEGGIRTLEGLLTLTPLAGARLRPLGHLSGSSPKRPFAERAMIPALSSLGKARELSTCFRRHRSSWPGPHPHCRPDPVRA